MKHLFVLALLAFAAFTGLKHIRHKSSALPPTEVIEQAFARLDPSNTGRNVRVGQWQESVHRATKGMFDYYVPYKARVARIAIERKTPFVSRGGDVPVGSKAYPVVVKRDVERDYNPGDVPLSDLMTVLPKSASDETTVYYYEVGSGLWYFARSAVDR